jgi:hypothetical protein
MMSADIQLRGLIIPIDWYRDGKIKTIALATHDEQYVVIRPGGIKFDLSRLLRQEVELTGYYDSPPNETTFCVKDLKHLKNPPGRWRDSSRFKR